MHFHFTITSTHVSRLVNVLLCVTWVYCIASREQNKFVCVIQDNILPIKPISLKCCYVDWLGQSKWFFSWTALIWGNPYIFDALIQCCHVCPNSIIVLSLNSHLTRFDFSIGGSAAVEQQHGRNTVGGRAKQWQPWLRFHHPSSFGC